MKTLNWKSTVMWTALSLLFLLLALMVGPAPALAADATLYELTENMKVVAKHGPHRKATSELMGTANAGTPLCPLPVTCTINATGSDNISLATGLGDFRGTFTVVVQDNNLVDSPEYVVTKGKFRGKMDFSLAILHSVPYGTVVGTMELDGARRSVPFTGTFFLPFPMPWDPSGPAYYLDFNPSNPYGVVPVADNQKALGYATVKFEITF